MTRTTAQEHFHRWLEARRWRREEEPPFSIGLKGCDPELCSQIGQRVADYLSEVDSGAPDAWLLFDEELVSDQNLAALREAFPKAVQSASPCSEQGCGYLLEFANLGATVIYLPRACCSLENHPDLFIAEIRAHENEPGAAPAGGDLSIDIDRLGLSTAVRVIADSALEWATGRSERQPDNVTPWKS